MEVNTGTVLYEKNSHEKHYPASITKILTTYLTILNCKMDEKVTFSKEAVRRAVVVRRASRGMWARR